MAYKDPEKAREYQRNYKLEHKEEIAVYNAEYQQENKEAIKVQRAGFRRENKEAIAVKKAKHYQENKEDILAKSAEYKQENKEAIAVKNAKYRGENKEAIEVQQVEHKAKKKAIAMQDYLDNFHTLDLSVGSPRVFVFSSIKNSYKNEAFREANHAIVLKRKQACWFCKKPFTPTGKRRPVIEHGIPVKRAEEFGMTLDEVHSPDNLWVCCQACNTLKRTDTWQEFAPEIWQKMKDMKPIIISSNGNHKKPKRKVSA